MLRFTLEKSVGYSSLEAWSTRLFKLENSPLKKNSLILNFKNSLQITPTGHALLALLLDHLSEKKLNWRTLFTKSLLSAPLLQFQLFKQGKPPEYFPAPEDYSFESDALLFQGLSNSLRMGFLQRFEEKFSPHVHSDTLFAAQMILSELMQNTLDHSGAERHYLYAGLTRGKVRNELHLGSFDAGVTIPARLEQKYNKNDANNDAEFLALALKSGTTTRRQRPGGLGLALTLEYARNLDGTLHLFSRYGRLIYYFKNNSSKKSISQHRVNGTWCAVRLPL